mmetsp:Transcript_15681/g.32249  ORF Transcript_15681/g.32249 Transcript_15681/m.32249 type:complete len:196 (+) Transcript_15681:93-680(+)
MLMEGAEEVRSWTLPIAVLAKTENSSARAGNISAESPRDVTLPFSPRSVEHTSPTQECPIDDSSSHTQGLDETEKLDEIRAFSPSPTEAKIRTVRKPWRNRNGIKINLFANGHGTPDGLPALRTVTAKHSLQPPLVITSKDKEAPSEKNENYIAKRLERITAEFELAATEEEKAASEQASMRRLNLASVYGRVRL